MGDVFEKKWKNILKAALFAAALLLAFRYALPLAAPFLLAFAVVYACEPMLERVHEKFHIRREISLAGMFGGGACGRGDLRVLFVGDAPCGEAWGRGGARTGAGGWSDEGLL